LCSAHEAECVVGDDDRNEERDERVQPVGALRCQDDCAGDGDAYGGGCVATVSSMTDSMLRSPSTSPRMKAHVIMAAAAMMLMITTGIPWIDGAPVMRRRIASAATVSVTMSRKLELASAANVVARGWPCSWRLRRTAMRLSEGLVVAFGVERELTDELAV
jgi:hypothetical protein